MKLIFYRDINSGKLIQHQRLPKTMTEYEAENAIHRMNDSFDKKSTVEMVEIDEYHEFLLKKAEERQIYSLESVQSALEALDDAIDCIRCLKRSDTND